MNKRIKELEKKVESSDGIKKIENLNELAFEYHKVNPELTEKYANEALVLAKKIKYNEGIACSLNYIGISYHLRSKFDLALMNYKKSLKIYKGIVNTNQIARLYSNIGGLFERKGEYQEATKYQFLSIEILEKGENKKGLASSYNNLAINYQKMNKFEDALSYYLKSFDLKKEIGDKKEFSTSYNNIGAIYEKLRKFDLALDYLLKSLKYKEKYHPERKETIAITLTNIGVLCNEKKDYSSALSYFRKSLVLSENIKDLYSTTNCKINLARTYFSLKDYKSTKMFLEQAQIVAIKIGAKELESQCYNIFTNLYEDQNKFEKAFEYLKKETNLNQVLFNEKQEVIVTEIKAKYEFEKKKRENEIIKFENKKLDKANIKLKKEISERKKAEEKIQEYADSKELLLQEVNHRVKNNLYTITSILNKEKDKISKKNRLKKKYNPEELLSDLTNRINSLSAVHSILSASEWQPVFLDLFFEEMTNHFFNVIVKEDLKFIQKKKLTVIIDSFQAHQLALIYNEILTNAVKYSKKKLDELDIGINLSVKDGFITIVIRDNGVGFSKEILEYDFTNTGIGFDLIFGITEQSLGGVVTLENNNGAVITLKIKQAIK